MRVLDDHEHHVHNIRQAQDDILPSAGRVKRKDFLAPHTLGSPQPDLISVDWVAWKKKVAGEGVNADDALCCWGMIWGEQMTALSAQSDELCGPPPDVSQCTFDAGHLALGGLKAAAGVGGTLNLAFMGEITGEMTQADFWIKPENRIEVGKSLCKGANKK